jgi:hypothetical protein
MAIRRKKFATLTHVLASAVADDGTVEVAYPSGYTQANFNTGLNDAGSYVVINGNNKWSATDPGIGLSYDSSVITVTNLTGAAWAAGDELVFQFEIVDGDFVVPFMFPINLASVADGDVITSFKPMMKGKIVHMSFTVNVPVTTASKLSTLNAEIGTTNLTGVTIALTSANCTPMGATIHAAAITGNNTVTEDDLISIEASSTTAFAEGSGTLAVFIRPDFEDAY